MTHSIQNPKLKIQNCCSTLSPEEQLIILSAQLNLDEETAIRFKQILSGDVTGEVPITEKSGNHKSREPRTKNPTAPCTLTTAPFNPKLKSLDWEYILTTAHRLGIAPLMYKHLFNPGLREKVPNHVHQTLKNSYQKAAFQSLRIQGQIQKINQAATDHQIPIIFLKGTALSQWLYKDIALRPMSDVDLLVREEDVSAISQILITLGYKPVSCYPSPFHENFQFRGCKHLPEFVKRGAANIEVHTNLFCGTAEGSEETRNAWGRILPITLYNGSGYGLCLEDLSLYLFAHTANHLRSYSAKLYWFSDLREVIRKNIDWSTFWQRAGDLQLREEVIFVQSLLGLHFQPESPSTRCPLVKDGLWERDIIEILHVVLEGKRDEMRKRKTFIGQKEKFLVGWRLKGWRQRITFLGRYLFPVTENIIYRYHVERPSMVPIFYLLHLLIFFNRLFVGMAWHCKARFSESQVWSTGSRTY